MVSQKLISVGKTVEQRTIIYLTLGLNLYQIEDLLDNSFVSYDTVGVKLPILLRKVNFLQWEHKRVDFFPQHILSILLFGAALCGIF